MILKLEKNGVSGPLLNLFKSDLNNRNQRVVLNGSFPELSIIESGEQQSFIVGPLQFFIYLNDLEKIIKSNIKFWPMKPCYFR